MAQSSVDLELLKSVVEENNSGALRMLNENALAAFRESGLPTTRDEDWKYTNLETLAKVSNAWLGNRAAGSAPVATEAASPPEGIEATWMRIANGVIDDASLVRANEALDGQAVLSKLSAQDGHVDLLLDNAVASFNASLIGDALCLRIRKGVALESPVGIFLDDVAGDTPTASHTRLLLVLEENSSAEVIEFHGSTGSAAHYATVITEIDVAAGANVRFVKIQERARHHSQLGQIHAHCGKDATFQHAAVDIGGATIRNDVIATIKSPGAHFSSAGLCLTEDGQHVDNHVTADHCVGPATSEQNYRYIASGRSRCVFNGKAVVREGADGTDAKQNNHSLLLSEKAEIDTKPELEIYAEDVKCAHGATVGQLDKKSLFYLRSRGLDKEQAAQMLTRAFANTVLDDVPIDSVREYLSETVDQKLDRLVGDPGS